MEIPHNNFKVYAAAGAIFAIICLFFACVTFAFATVTPQGYESICALGASGMTPSLEVALIQSGVYTPSPQIIYRIGNPLPAYDYDRTFGIGSNWLIILRM
jgi:hypothetical protein